MGLFDKSFHDLLGVEGKYSNHPADRGGETMWGITERRARESGYTGPMRDMPVEVAKTIYRSRYWDRMNLDSVGIIYPNVAQELFDTGVNMGTRRAVQFLQRTLNVLDKQPEDGLKVDGLMGPRTIEELRAYSRKRGSRGGRGLVRGLDALQGARYIELAEADPSQELFVFGWLSKRVGGY